MAEAPVLLAHLSDLHVDGSERNLARARRAVDYLAGLPGRLDAVLVTGDIADSGSERQYEEVAGLLAPLADRAEVLVCPGNHDHRATFRAGLPGSWDSEPDDPLDQARTVSDLTIAVCDSTIAGRNEGRLGDATLDWLDGVLGAAGGPALVALHHPPAPIGIPYLDGMRLQEPERLAAVIGRHPNVVGVLCGHAHAAVASSFAGVPLRVAPGVTSRAMLPWESDELMDETAPPALAFHRYADGALTTYVRSV
ncbi:MAG: metallophosphoesterase [Frankiaceae bacterium]